MAVAGSILLVAATWSSVEVRYPQSALAHVVPGRTVVAHAALVDLRDLPELQPGAVEGAELLDEHLPGRARSIVLTGADLSVEILVRAERGSSVPLGDPWEDSFVPEGHLDALAARSWTARRAASSPSSTARPGGVRRLPARPDPRPDGQPARRSTLVPTGLAPLQKVVLHGDRPSASPSERSSRTEGGLEVVELTDLG